ncbi:hypothetical protein Tco_0618593 [Tanacetum coccineum]
MFGMYTLNEMFKDLGYIEDHDVNDDVGKELDADSRNSSKIPLVTFHQTGHVGKDGTIIATDFYVCDSENEFPSPWSIKKCLKIELEGRVMSLSSEDRDGRCLVNGR